MSSYTRHASDGTPDRTTQPQPPLGEDLLTPLAVQAGELRPPVPTEHTPGIPEETPEETVEITEDYIKHISARDPTEDEATYRLRLRYTLAILNLSPQIITLEEAIPLGFMIIKKTRYGITYSTAVENRIQEINQLLMNSPILERTQSRTPEPIAP